MRALREVYVALADDARQEALSPAAEWLLDNFHIITAAERDIHRPSRRRSNACRSSRPMSSPAGRASTRSRSN